MLSQLSYPPGKLNLDLLYITLKKATANNLNI
jgi:hypothetical protein